MKKIIALACMAWLGLAGVLADNISAEDISLKATETATVEINLTNTATNLVGFQMDLTLPEGIGINKAGCQLSSRFGDPDQALTIGKQGDNVYRLTSTSFALTPISGTSGTIITLSLTASENAQGGTATLSGIVFATSNSEEVALDDASFNITVEESFPAITFADANVKALCVQNWDTDGDGELSMDEAAAVTDLGTVFQYNTTITSFDELQYFTGLASIGEYAFYSCSSLTSVSIPNSVTSIDGSAFDGCSGLSSITIPNSVTTIGDRAFFGCSGLTSVTISSSVTNIGNGAFGSCNSLTSISVESGNTNYDSRDNCNAIIETTSNTLIAGCKNTVIPTSVTSIGDNAFAGCEELTSIDIPTSVTSIGDNAFGCCYGLTSITLPNSVTSIGNSAFGCCHALVSVTMPNSVMVIRNNTFGECESLTSVTIPNSVTSIEDYAFYDCSGLTSVTIPNSVTSIGDNAFSGCNGLTSVKVELETPISIGSYTFPNSANATLYVPAGSKGAYEAADNWKEFQEIIESTSSDRVSITISSSGAATYCSDIDLDFTNVVGLRAYIATDYLISYDEPTSMSIPTGYIAPDNVDKIPYVKMRRVYKVPAGTGLYLEGEEGTYEVPYGASSSQYYNLLIGTTVPVRLNNTEEITYFGLSRLSRTTQITSGDDDVIGFFKLRNNSNISAYKAYMQFPTEEIQDITMFNIVYGETNNITFADANVKTICVQNWDTDGDGELSEDEAAAVTDLGAVFKGNTTITSFDELQYFTGLTNIGNEAFRDCSGLTSVTIPSSVTSIGESAFRECSGLTSVNIPESVTSIGKWAFYHCNKLTSVTIPNSVESIGLSAFYLCSSLTSMTIPNSVTSIGNAVFSQCTSLTSITVENGNSYYVSENGVLFNKNKTSLFCFPAGKTQSTYAIPESVTEIRPYAFDHCRSLTSVTIPNSVTSIGNYAFNGCSKLTSVTIPNSVTTLGYYAFYQCTGLTSVSIGNSVTSIGMSTFRQCTSLNSITIPNSVTRIDMEAFKGCTSLTSATIPESVTSIGVQAFKDCPVLTSVQVGMESPLTIDSEAFTNRANATLYVPAGCKAAYEAANYWKEFKEIVEYGGIEQTLALETLPSMTYGDDAYTLPETTAEGLTLTWTIDNTAVATVSGNVLAINGAGTAAITATQAGNDSYLPFSREFSLTVGKAALTITANDCTKVEGEENPELTVSYEGFVNDDDASVLTQQPTVTTEATTDSPAGTYPITVTGAEAANYDISYVAGTLTVEEAKIEPTDISQLDNAIYVDPVETVSNSTYALNIKAKNNVTVAGMSFTLTLPDDFSLITDDGGIISTLDSQRASSSKFMVMSSQSGNSYLIRVLPISGTTISGTDGTVLTVRLKNINAEEGTYELKVNNSSFTVKNADNTFETLPLVDVISTIEITGNLLGDVNGDGNVDLTDAIMIVNHSLDNTPSNFRIDVADVNGDGNIDLTDAIIVVNMSMDSSSMARQAFMMNLDPE